MLANRFTALIDAGALAGATVDALKPHVLSL